MYGKPRRQSRRTRLSRHRNVPGARSAVRPPGGRRPRLRRLRKPLPGPLRPLVRPPARPLAAARRRAPLVGTVPPTRWWARRAARCPVWTRYCPIARRRAALKVQARPAAAPARTTRRLAAKRVRMSLTIGVDVGGTKIAAGVVDAKGSIIEMVKRPTPAADPAATIDEISGAVRDLLRGHEVEAVGIGAAGFVEESRSAVMFAPNLAWREEHVARQVEDRVDRPVVVENDANAAAWAETKLGAGRGHDHVILITIGTGIGAGVGLRGQLRRGRRGGGG